MPGQFKSFDDETTAEHRSDGPSFQLAGETFTCVPVAPAGVLSDMLAAIQTDSRGRQVFASINIVNFMLGVLRDRKWVVAPDAEYVDGALPGRWEPADDNARFEALVYDKHRAVPVEKLGELLVWLSEVYTERPTTPSVR